MKQKIIPLLAALLLLLAPGTLKAQRIHAYVSGGAVTSQIEGDELKGFKHWGGTGGVGAVARLDRDGSFSLAVEADYSGRGIYNNSHSIENPYNIRLNLHYVDIPLSVIYRDPWGGLRIGVGLCYSRLVAQPHGTIEFNPNYFVPDTTDMTFLKNDLSPLIELRIPIWNGLQLSARYQFSVIAVKRDWHFTENGNTWANNCFNQSLMIRLQWQFGDDDTHNRKAHGRGSKGKHKRYRR